MRADREVQFEEAGVAQQLGRKFAAQGGKPVGGSEDQRFITVLVIPMMQGFCPFLWNDFRTSVQEVDDSGNVKNVLVESGKEEYFVAP